MRSSFRSHIYRQFFLLNLLITVVLFGMVELIYEDIELNMITLEMKNEQAHHFEMLGDKAEIWRTSTTISAYVPASLETFPQLPEVFQGLEVPFWDDIVLGEKEYMIEITELPQGELYIARDIALFEQREDVFEAGMYVIGGMFVLLNFVLAVFSARRIVRPLSELTQDIHRITPETRSARVPWTTRSSSCASTCARIGRPAEPLGSPSSEQRTTPPTTMAQAWWFAPGNSRRRASRSISATTIARGRPSVPSRST